MATSISGARREEQDRLRGSVDAKLLEDLYRRYSGSVFRRACLLMGDRDNGKDVMQEVFLRALQARAEFDRAASQLAWLYRITTNNCLNRLRDARRRRDALERTWNVGEPITRPTTDAALTVLALLERVPEDTQEMAIYYFIDQMSQEEIALLMSIPRRTISYRLEQFRAEARLAIGDERMERVS
jgi:RNA polymerase sigma-70 factor (ECF subfamily)